MNLDTLRSRKSLLYENYELSTQQEGEVQHKHFTCRFPGSPYPMPATARLLQKL